MSSNGGAYRHEEPTSFGLRPPRPPEAYPDTTRVSPYPRGAGVPHPAGADPQYAPPQPAAPDGTPERTPGADRLIAGRYRLIAKLGHGGMGTVWRAKDETVDREVAVKEPRLPEHLPEQERGNVYERMRREARAAARLDHPAVVSVHDVVDVDGRPWIVMELVRGRSLGDALKEGTLGGREAARIGLEVLGALEAAHGAGVLHRDVKPDNVLLGRHDRVVLTDFGIAHIEGETHLTDTGGFVGSPEYIAPERVLGQRPGPASDLWSLGVVLYAATEGVSPFRRSNTPATLQSVLHAAPAVPASATGPLAEAINGLLRKDPAHRLGAAQVRQLLERAAAPPLPVPPPVQTVPMPGTGEEGKPGLRIGRKALFGIGGGLAAAVLALVLVVADPFAGPLPDGWTVRAQPKLGAELAVPAGYQVVRPEKDDENQDWVRYRDWSSAIWINLSVTRASDKDADIKNSAAAQMYADNEKYRDDGDSDLKMPPGSRTDPEETTYRERKAAENTIRWTTDDKYSIGDDLPVAQELRLFYYLSSRGDLYSLTVQYPGKGDFTARGREVADKVIANLEIGKL